MKHSLLFTCNVNNGDDVVMEKNEEERGGGKQTYGGCCGGSLLFRWWPNIVADRGDHFGFYMKKLTKLKLLFFKI